MPYGMGTPFLGGMGVPLGAAPALQAALPPTKRNELEDAAAPFGKRQRLAEAEQVMDFDFALAVPHEMAQHEPAMLDPPANPVPTSEPVPMPTMHRCPPCFAHRFCRSDCLVEKDRLTYAKMDYRDTASFVGAAHDMMDL